MIFDCIYHHGNDFTGFLMQSQVSYFVAICDFLNITKQHNLVTEKIKKNSL